jgi:2-pyrone-4,6-dicarboxylate lactonase
VTRPCPGPYYATRPPRIAPPPGSVDCMAHVFGPSDNFHYADGRGYTPPDCPVDSYITLQDTLGIARGVIVHGSPHGSDNHVSLDAIARYPDRLRGVCVVPPAVT